MNYILFIIVIVLNIYLLKKRVNVGLIMFINTFYIIIVKRMSIDDIGFNIFKALVSDRTIGLIIVLVLIMMMENIMRNKGMIALMVKSLKTIFRSSKMTALILPMFVGMLPSPGGAHFSCPMVERTLMGSNINNVDKAFNNLWFRHVWIDGFFLYPATLLAASIMNVSVITLFLHIIPFMIVWFLAGYFVSIRKIEMENHINNSINKKVIIDLFKTISPIVFAVVVYLILLQIRIVPFPLQVSVGLIVILLLIYKKYTFLGSLKVLKASIKVDQIILICGVMTFVFFLSTSGIVNDFIDIIYKYNIPLALLIIILPVIGGYTSGLSINYISISLPILSQIGLGSNMWTIATIFCFGELSLMFTPTHLCCIMTSDYFDVSVIRLFRRQVPAAVIVFVIAFLVMFINI